MDKKLGKGKIKIGEETVITLYRGVRKASLLRAFDQISRD